MDKRSTVFAGLALILLGILSLVFTTLASVLGFEPLSFVWRLWPSVVVGLGALFVLVPFLVRGKRGLGGFFIPGFPILMTGSMLFLASLFDAWEIWAWLWPMELLSLAMGFLCAAIYMKVIWLIIPAIIIGINGLVFQFCAITGLWSWWSVLWVMEPLSVGLALLAAGTRTGKSALSATGLGICCFAGMALLLMITVLDGWWPLRLLGSGLIVLAGVGVLLWGLIRPRSVPRSVE